MFSTGNVWLTTFAVMFGIAFIMTGVYYVNKLFINSTKDILVRFILLVFAVRKKNSLTCSGTQIKILGENKNFFLDSNEIKAIVIEVSGKNLIGKKVIDIDVKKIKKGLKSHPWIQRVDVFVNKSGKLIIEVEEKNPVARVFMKEGTSFYIDEQVDVLPLKNNVVIQLPIFTNFDASLKSLTKKDSITLKEVGAFSSYLQKDSFSMAMIDQIYINDNAQFELIPKFGNQVFSFGGATDIEEKINKMKIFYSKVIPNYGWSRYNKIALQYKGQIVATIKGTQDIITDSLRTKAMVKAMAEYSFRKSADSSLQSHADEANNNTNLDMILQSVERQVPEEKGSVSTPEKPVEKSSNQVALPKPAIKLSEKKVDNSNKKTNKVTPPKKGTKPKTNKPTNDY